jgi:hypothetical protein
MNLAIRVFHDVRHDAVEVLAIVARSEAESWFEKARASLRAGRGVRLEDA